MEEIKPKLGFDVKYQDNAIRFVYEQAKYGAHLGCGLFILSFFFPLVVGAMLSPLLRAIGEGPANIFRITVFIASPILLLRYLNNKRGVPRILHY